MEILNKNWIGFGTVKNLKSLLNIPILIKTINGNIFLCYYMKGENKRYDYYKAKVLNGQIIVSKEKILNKKYDIISQYQEYSLTQQ